MRDLENNGLGRVFKDELHLADVLASIDANRRFPLLRPSTDRTFSVQHALDVGKECHEFAIVTFLKFARIDQEFVDQPFPWPAIVEQLPMAVDLLAFFQWHQLHRPKQDLAELLHHRRVWACRLRLLIGFRCFGFKRRQHDGLPYTQAPDIRRPVV